MENIIIVGNCIFIRMDISQDFKATPKYAYAASSGVIINTHQYTKEEIQNKFPDSKLKVAKSFLELPEVWKRD